MKTLSRKKDRAFENINNIYTSIKSVQTDFSSYKAGASTLLTSIARSLHEVETSVADFYDTYSNLIQKGRKQYNKQNRTTQMNQAVRSAQRQSKYADSNRKAQEAIHEATESFNATSQEHITKQEELEQRAHEKKMRQVRDFDRQSGRTLRNLTESFQALKISLLDSEKGQEQLSQVPEKIQSIRDNLNLSQEDWQRVQDDLSSTFRDFTKATGYKVSMQEFYDVVDELSGMGIKYKDMIDANGNMKDSYKELLRYMNINQQLLGDTPDSMQSFMESVFRLGWATDDVYETMTRNSVYLQRNMPRFDTDALNDMFNFIGSEAMTAAMKSKFDTPEKLNGFLTDYMAIASSIQSIPGGEGVANVYNKMIEDAMTGNLWEVLTSKDRLGGLFQGYDIAKLQEKYNAGDLQGVTKDMLTMFHEVVSSDKGHALAQTLGLDVKELNALKDPDMFNQVLSTMDSTITALHGTIKIGDVNLSDNNMKKFEELIGHITWKPISDVLKTWGAGLPIISNVVDGWIQLGVSLRDILAVLSIVTVADALSPLLGGIGKGAGKLGKGVLSFLGKPFKWIGEKFNFSDFFKNKFGKWFGGKGTAPVAAGAEGLADAVGSVKNAGGGFGSSVYNFFKGLFDLMGQAGKGIGKFIEGVFSGISKGISAFASIPLAAVGKFALISAIFTGTLVGIGFAFKLAAPGLEAIAKITEQLKGIVGHFVTVVKTLADVAMEGPEVAKGLAQIGIAFSAFAVSMGAFVLSSAVSSVFMSIGSQEGFNRMMKTLEFYTSFMHDMIDVAREFSGKYGGDLSKIFNPLSRMFESLNDGMGKITGISWTFVVADIFNYKDLNKDVKESMEILSNFYYGAIDKAIEFLGAVSDQDTPKIEAGLNAYINILSTLNSGLSTLADFQDDYKSYDLFMMSFGTSVNSFSMGTALKSLSTYYTTMLDSAKSFITYSEDFSTSEFDARVNTMISYLNTVNEGLINLSETASSSNLSVKVIGIPIVSLVSEQGPAWSEMSKGLNSYTEFVSEISATITEINSKYWNISYLKERISLLNTQISTSIAAIDSLSSLDNTFHFGINVLGFVNIVNYTSSTKSNWGSINEALNKYHEFISKLITDLDILAGKDWDSVKISENTSLLVTSVNNTIDGITKLSQLDDTFHFGINTLGFINILNFTSSNRTDWEQLNRALDEYWIFANGVQGDLDLIMLKDWDSVKIQENTAILSKYLDTTISGVKQLGGIDKKFHFGINTIGFINLLNYTQYNSPSWDRIKIALDKYWEFVSTVKEDIVKITENDWDPLKFNINFAILETYLNSTISSINKLAGIDKIFHFGINTLGIFNLLNYTQKNETNWVSVSDGLSAYSVFVNQVVTDINTIASSLDFDTVAAENKINLISTVIDNAINMISSIPDTFNSKSFEFILGEESLFSSYSTNLIEWGKVTAGLTMYLNFFKGVSDQIIGIDATTVFDQTGTAAAINVVLDVISSAITTIQDLFEDFKETKYEFKLSDKNLFSKVETSTANWSEVETALGKYQTFFKNTVDFLSKYSSSIKTIGDSSNDITSIKDFIETSLSSYQDFLGSVKGIMTKKNIFGVDIFLSESEQATLKSNIDDFATKLPAFFTTIAGSLDGIVKAYTAILSDQELQTVIDNINNYTNGEELTKLSVDSVLSSFFASTEKMLSQFTSVVKTVSDNKELFASMATDAQSIRSAGDTMSSHLVSYREHFKDDEAITGFMSSMSSYFMGAINDIGLITAGMLGLESSFQSKANGILTKQKKSAGVKGIVNDFVTMTNSIVGLFMGGDMASSNKGLTELAEKLGAAESGFGGAWKKFMTGYNSFAEIMENALGSVDDNGNRTTGVMSDMINQMIYIISDLHDQLYGKDKLFASLTSFQDESGNFSSQKFSNTIIPFFDVMGSMIDNLISHSDVLSGTGNKLITNMTGVNQSMYSALSMLSVFGLNAEQLVEWNKLNGRQLDFNGIGLAMNSLDLGVATGRLEQSYNRNNCFFKNCRLDNAR